MQDQSIPARQMVAQLQVERLLKGELERRNFSFRFVVNDFSGYREIPVSQFGIFFLRKVSKQEYTVTDHYYPFVVAAMEAPVNQGDAFDKVVAELANVLTLLNTSREDRIQAISALRDVKHETAVAALRRMTEQPDLGLRLRAVVVLLWQNDVSVIKIAEDALLRPPPNVDKGLLTNLALAIEGIKDPRAIPNLTHLLNAPEVLIRRSAASALRHTGSPDAIGPLTKALDDSDREVRYYATIGLAELTGQYEWGPSVDLFRRDEGRYLSYWREWAKTRQ